MIDRKVLLDDLKDLLKKLEADLLERSESAEVPDVGLTLRKEYTAAQAAARTAQSFEEWRSDAITQAAAAWVLSCVFVRFLEDNELVPTPKIAGPDEGLKRARDEHELYFCAHPTHNDRDYLLDVFDGLMKHAATKEVFGAHNPIRDLPNWLSGDAAGTLIAFFQKIDPNTGVLVHDFTDPDWDTRFLGDLYQDLSEAARKKYALLQTPVFVEEFILDRTLDPAIEEFGLAKMGYEARLLPDGRLHPEDRFKMIDPACGSGHFLLGSFARLVDRWRKKEPGSKDNVLIQRALDGVHGVDVNPYAIAIARFRLLLAALKECGIKRLSDAPGFEIHLACGDSLLHGSVRDIQQMFEVVDELKHVYQPEDPEALSRLLKPGNYHAVVANPPYITPKDPALNAAYRARYTTCHGQYSLSVPFLERIISIAVEGGFTGQITANSFMKREFGKKLIEEFFPRVDLTHVVNTDGAYIPGHGTPTVILFARNRNPVARTLRTVMGKRAEPSTPDDASKGLVWSAIMAQIDLSGSQSEYVSVADSPRERFHIHPWSICGGGAAELLDEIEASSRMRLNSFVDAIGRTTVVGEDDAWVTNEAISRRFLVHQHCLPFVVGQVVRDWSIEDIPLAIYPYAELGGQALDESAKLLIKRLWDLRIPLSNRTVFGKSLSDMGRPWWEHLEHYREKLRTPLSIAFAFVATHNHFILDRGGSIFNRSAPVIKLRPEADDFEHLVLLGLLNSSTACFWMKQIFYPKATSTGDISSEKGKPEMNRYEFTATGLEQFPIPFEPSSATGTRVGQIAALIESLALQLQCILPVEILRGFNGSDMSQLRTTLQNGRDQYQSIHERMIALQEELDWEVYRAFGLCSEGLDENIIAELTNGIPADARPFLWEQERAPSSVPSAWVGTYQRRRGVIRHSHEIAIVEDVVYKRPWWGRQGVYGRLSRDYEGWTKEAGYNWLLDRLESYLDFDGRMNDAGKPTARLPIGLLTVGKLADIALQDPDFLQVGDLYRNDSAFDVTRLVDELVERESVPLLPILRYKPSGLRKREEWENTWTLQRLEDAIDARVSLPKDDPRRLSELDAKELKKKEIGTIPVPPKYTSADFLKPDYWRLRGKLDVPKERWVSFPHCEGEDGTLMVAWAGYDHLQLARAISAYYVDVQERLGGRDDPRLIPLLACLIELLPWLKQWHNDIDPEFGVPMGDYFEGFLQEESRNLGLTLDQIKAWQPPRKSPRPRRKGSR